MDEIKDGLMFQRAALDAEAPTGAQSIERAFGVLRAVAGYGRRGARLADVVADMGIPKPTVRRMLAAMIREGAIEQDPGSRLYFLGVDVYAFGLVAADRHGIRNMAIPSLVQLAEFSEDTVFLSAPSGNDAICLHCEEGAFPIPCHALAVGRRYPLGVGAGSLALLAAMPDDEIDLILRANAAICVERYPMHTESALRGAVERTRRTGYALIEGWVVPEGWGVGVVISDGGGRPVAALSIAAIVSRMGPDRQQELVRAMYTERDRIFRSDTTRAEPGPPGARAASRQGARQPCYTPG